MEDFQHSIRTISESLHLCAVSNLAECLLLSQLLTREHSNHAKADLDVHAASQPNLWLMMNAIRHGPL